MYLNWTNKCKAKLPWIIIILLGVVFLSLFYSFQTPLPKGISYAGPLRNSQFEFIYDLRYQKNGEMVHEGQIFSKIKSLIAEAREFIVIDMFLFNDDYDRKNSFPRITGELTGQFEGYFTKYPSRSQKSKRIF